jgi:hypothetical protein
LNASPNEPLAAHPKRLRQSAFNLALGYSESVGNLSARLAQHVGHDEDHAQILRQSDDNRR